MLMYSWGRGEDGQLGLGDTNDRSCPVLVEPLRARGGVEHIACGSGHTVILTSDGNVLTWGRGDDGRLGHGDNGWKYVPRVVEALPACTQVGRSVGRSVARARARDRSQTTLPVRL